MLDINNEIEDNKKDKIVYELGYLLVPTLDSEEAPTVFGDLKELLSSFEGDHISNEMPKMISLAYPMLKVVSNVRNKFDTAYFGWIKFFMDSGKVSELKNKVDLDPNILRFLILKTVQGNTIASKRFSGRDSAYRKPSYKKNEKKEVVPINKEEVDKEIDAMVAV